jgi:rSAM/selenodomain-associated transferase 2
MNEFELTIIIPTLNEEQLLARTLAGLGCQQRVAMEIIVVDGGSQDATREIVRETLPEARLIVTGPGRCRQLNAGAGRASGELLLFLHADSSFRDPLALRRGIDQLRQASGRDNPTVGGHFSLIFDRSGAAPSMAFTFYQRKARLNRPGCCHGDQGYLIPRALFTEVGPFDEQCELLSQTRFADRMRQNGQWMRLAPELITSSRRFETEGLRRRQTLNAIIMACGAAGRDDFLARLPTPYRQQRESERLNLQPFLVGLHAMIAALPASEYRVFWQRIGGYVVENTWQVALFLDVLAGCLLKRNAWLEQTPLVALFDRYLYRWVGKLGGTYCAAHLARCWLTIMQLPPLPRKQNRERSAQGGQPQDGSAES